MRLEITTRMLLDLANVTRWSAIRTIRRQNVAEHTFGVMVAARWLADYKERNDDCALSVVPYSERDRMSKVYELALDHDGVEAVSNDMPHPFKAMYLPELKLIEASAAGHYHPDISLHVQIADMLECIAFIGFEKTLGNQSIFEVGDDVLHRLHELGADELVDPWIRELDLDDFPVLKMARQLRKAKEPKEVDPECPF